MRITCPECGAEYEIEPTLIPPSGREVQCSACDTVWNQTPETEKKPVKAEFGVSDNPERPAPDGPRPRLDDGTREILREEAQRQARAKRGDAGGTEADSRPADDAPAGPAPDADAADPPAKPSGPRLRADDRRTPPEPAPHSSPVPVAGLREDRPSGAARREEPTLARPAGGDRQADTARPRTDLLPDVEESGATITGPAERRRDPEPAEPPKDGSGGFLSGFVSILIVAILLIGIYLAAPSLAVRVPALEDLLASYVGVVNDLRQQVDLALQGLARAVSGIGA